jgi:hypothetical protein
MTPCRAAELVDRAPRVEILTTGHRSLPATPVRVFPLRLPGIA